MIADPGNTPILFYVHVTEICRYASSSTLSVLPPRSYIDRNLSSLEYSALVNQITHLFTQNKHWARPCFEFCLLFTPSLHPPISCSLASLSLTSCCSFCFARKGFFSLPLKQLYM